MKAEKRNEHKSVKELEQEVNAKQSEIRMKWKLKVKEKRNFRKGLHEKEVGWCDEHNDFCDIDSKCDPWDPIPATSEGERAIDDIMCDCYYIILRCKDGEIWLYCATPSKIPESFGAAQLQNHMAVSEAEDNP